MGDTIRCLSVGYKILTDAQHDEVSQLFWDCGIPEYEGPEVLVVVWDEHGDIIAAMTSCAGDWAVAVHPSRQQEGLARKMVEAALQAGESGYMVAASEEGLYFLHSLYYHLSDEQKESLEVPCWAELEAMEVHV
tara:strand:- start:4027 stop:4428 length:402 start_codon:yes stop_codon:yes gene_type:complete